MPRTPFRRDRAGASLVEYGALAGLIAVAAILAVDAVGGSVDNLFDDVAQSVSEAADATMAAPTGSGSDNATGADDGPPEQTAKLYASDGTPGDNFSWEVMMDGTLLIAGAPQSPRNGDAVGAAYLYDAAARNELLKLQPAELDRSDDFGRSVDVDAGRIAIGSPNDDDATTNAGAVYLFDAAGNPQSKLTASDAQATDFFGGAVALDGSVLAVGALGVDLMGTSSGAVYLFNADTGDQTGKLLPDGMGDYQAFGQSVSVDAGLVLVGANGDSSLQGAAYLFNAATGDQILKLTDPAGAANDNFGISVQLGDGHAVVGAYNHGGAGAAYVFDAATGDLVHKLVPTDGQADDFFGQDVAIADGRVIVGAPGVDGPETETYVGAVYLFDLATGAQIGPRLQNADAGHQRREGLAVAGGGGIVASGSPYFDGTPGPGWGAVYLYE